MYAVITTGGKQYRVTEGSIFHFEKLLGEPGEKIAFDQVLMLGDLGDAPQFGAPMVAGALVEGEITEQMRDKKIIIFKKKRRKGYRKRQGHRQSLTGVRITKILAA